MPEAVGSIAVLVRKCKEITCKYLKITRNQTVTMDNDLSQKMVTRGGFEPPTKGL